MEVLASFLGPAHSSDKCAGPGNEAMEVYIHCRMLEILLLAEPSLQSLYSFLLNQTHAQAFYPSHLVFTAF